MDKRLVRRLKLQLLLPALLAAGLASAALAVEATPDAMIRRMSEQVLASARANQRVRAGDLRPTMALIDSEVMPNVDFQRMTAGAVGPAWRQASPQQRQQLQEQFKILLVRTYAGALSGLRNETISVQPQRMAASDIDVVVRTEIRGHGDPIQLQYRMERTPGQGAGWRIYNVNILGIWLVETYRNQFVPEIQARGIDGLIAALAQRNRANSASQ